MLRAAIIMLAVFASTALAQKQTRPHSGTLIVIAESGNTITLKPTDLANMPRTKLTVQRDGRGVTYEGVLVAELLKRAGAALGKELRGDAVASYVVASATDDYQVVFSLAELDPDFSGSEIMVADRMNGNPLLADQGPIRMFVPRDVPGARSIRMLERIEVVRLPRR